MSQCHFCGTEMDLEWWLKNNGICYNCLKRQDTLGNKGIVVKKKRNEVKNNVRDR